MRWFQALQLLTLRERRPLPLKGWWPGLNPALLD
jgi:hypothetical protein